MNILRIQRVIIITIYTRVMKNFMLWIVPNFQPQKGIFIGKVRPRNKASMYVWECLNWLRWKVEKYPTCLRGGYVDECNMRTNELTSRIIIYIYIVYVCVCVCMCIYMRISLAYMNAYVYGCVCFKFRTYKIRFKLFISIETFYCCL